MHTHQYLLYMYLFTGKHIFPCMYVNDFLQHMSFVNLCLYNYINNFFGKSKKIQFSFQCKLCYIYGFWYFEKGYCITIIYIPNEWEITVLLLIRYEKRDEPISEKGSSLLQFLIFFFITLQIFFAENRVGEEKN